MPHAEYPGLARIAYAAYGDSIIGAPDFDDFGEPTRTAWQAAAQAVVNALREAEAQDGDVLTNVPQRPSPGRIVLVAMDPAKNNGATEAPAIITRAWTGTSINVRVLADNQPGDSEWRTSLIYVDDVTQLDRDSTARLYCWSWPPRI